MTDIDTTADIPCNVYKSHKKDGLYLLVEKGQDIEALPETLLVMFGTPEYCFEFNLHPDKKLIQEDAKQVIANITTQGFHLQLPPKNAEDD